MPCNIECLRGYILPKVMPNHFLRIFVSEAKKLPRNNSSPGVIQRVTPIESLTVVPRVVLGPCLTCLEDILFPRNTQNSKAIANCAITMPSSNLWVKLVSEKKTHAAMSMMKSQVLFPYLTILRVYLPFNGQRLQKAQQTQGVSTLTHSSP